MKTAVGQQVVRKCTIGKKSARLAYISWVHWLLSTPGQRHNELKQRSNISGPWGVAPHSM